MKIVSLVSQLEYTPSQLAQLKSLGEFINYHVQKISEDEIVKHIDDANILLVGGSGVTELSEDVLMKCKNLKFISALSSGVDYINIKAAAKLGIKVSNLRGANSESVAEHIWGLILGLSKKINESHRGLKDGRYEFLHYAGIELQGKTIGILGFGEIGSRVARIAKGFDMKIIAYNRSEKIAQGITFVDLNSVLKQSDVVVVCLPVNQDTLGILDVEKLKLMKQRSILVSISRESLIDKEAVLELLSDKKLFGFAMESDINTQPDSRFYNFENVIITPHTAFFTNESEEKSNNMAVENVMLFAQGTPRNLVN